jgi:hypothetical protein
MPIVAREIPLFNVLWLRPHRPNLIHRRCDLRFNRNHAANLGQRQPISLALPPKSHRIFTKFIESNHTITIKTHFLSIIATMKTPFNKYLYIGFLVLGIYQATVNKDYLQAASQLGIALAFDPFNPEQTWNDRPTWQKATLIIHLALVAALFGLAIGINDK